MRPSEYASIIVDAQNSFKDWCKENNADSGDKNLLEAYMSGLNLALVEFGKAVGDRLYEDNAADSGKIEEGKGISTYMENCLSAYVERLSEPKGESLTQISFEKYRDETFRMILTLLSSYSGKEIKTMDEDDGVEGEESEMRHQIFDGAFGTVAAIKSGVVGKEKVARAYRALADFFETL